MAQYNFLDDITKFGNNALSMANSMQRQVRSWVTEQVEYLIKSMELVKQEDLEVQFETRNKRVAELEERVAKLEKLPTASAGKEVKKPVAKKKSA